MKKPLASAAQARLLARVWGDFHPLPVSDDREHNTRTIATCIRSDWLVPDGGSKGQWHSGQTYTNYRISHAGIVALSAYLESAYSASAA